MGDTKMKPELTFAVLKMRDTGLPKDFFKGLEKSCAEEGLRVTGYATWFNSGETMAGPEGTWMVTVQLEHAHAHRS
jgi:hypothetical protein